MVFAKILSSVTHEACQKDPTYFIGPTKSVLSKNWFLTTLTGKKCVLLSSLQELIKTEAWLFLTFFICSNNHLSSLHSIVTY